MYMKWLERKWYNANKIDSQQWKQPRAILYLKHKNQQHFTSCSFHSITYSLRQHKSITSLTFLLHFCCAAVSTVSSSALTIFRYKFFSRFLLWRCCDAAAPKFPTETKTPDLTFAQHWNRGDWILLVNVSLETADTTSTERQVLAGGQSKGTNKYWVSGLKISVYWNNIEKLRQLNVFDKFSIHLAHFVPQHWINWSRSEGNGWHCGVSYQLVTE